MPAVTRSKKKKGSRQKTVSKGSGKETSSRKLSGNKEKTARRQQINDDLWSFIEGIGQNLSRNPGEDRTQKDTSQELPRLTEEERRTPGMTSQNARTSERITPEDNSNLANVGQWPRLQSPITPEQRTQSANTQQTNTKQQNSS